MYRANKRILFIDMNSFFASVEQAENPSLHGKPVIVVPTEGSCALSASYEAKKFGIHTGTLEREARFLCPELVAVRARPKLYMTYHHRLEALLSDISPRVTMRSVDEGSLELFRNEEPWQLAKQIKERIWQEFSPAVHCSIGIAPNISLAKLATELQKPNGLVEIRLEDLPTIFKKIKLRDLCGINRGMEHQLNRIGIYSPTEFYQADPSYLRQALGVMGWRWWLRLHGYEIDTIEHPRRTLSHSHVLPPKLRLPKQAYTTLQRLISKVGRRLRKIGYMAQQVSLIVVFADHSSAYHFFNITPTNDTLTLGDHFTSLWQKVNPNSPILKLAIWTARLTPAIGVPAPLFPESQKRYRLAKALDTVNDRYGADTIHFATLDTEGSRAPDRISFTALFEIEHE